MFIVACIALIARQDAVVQPNVKDEPRAGNAGEAISNYCTWGAKNRWSKSQGQSARWLWRLVGRIGQMPDAHEGKDDAPEEEGGGLRESRQSREEE